MALYPKFYNLCKFTYYKPYERKDREFIICIGEPGTGKTKYALEFNPDSVWDNIVGTTGWFDGYTGQEVAVIDDYGLDGTVFKLTDLLKLTHGWTQKVAVKYGHTIWNPKYLFLTTNYHPLCYYKLNADFEKDRIDRWISYAAFVRRVTKVLWFSFDDEGNHQEPWECKDIEAFMYDIDKKFEHQEVPNRILAKFSDRRNPVNIKELIKATKRLIIKPQKVEGRVYRSESYTYNYDDIDGEDYE